MFGNGLLRRLLEVKEVEVTGELRTFHTEEPHNLYCADVVRVNKSAGTRSRRMCYAWGR
jgi:hypothetical protein